MFGSELMVLIAGRWREVQFQLYQNENILSGTDVNDRSFPRNIFFPIYFPFLLFCKGWQFSLGNTSRVPVLHYKTILQHFLFCMYSNRKVNIDSSDLLGCFMLSFSCIWLYCFKEANTKNSKLLSFILNLVSFISEFQCFMAFEQRAQVIVAVP